MFYKHNYFLKTMMISEKYNQRKLLNKIIHKSFPTLKNKKIFVYHLNLGDLSGSANWFLPFWRAIFINHKRKFSKNEMIALMVHELCHLEIYHERGWLKTSFFGFYYWTSSSFRKNEEYKTDERVIKKGYAKNIYCQRLLRWKQTPKNHKLKKIYMSPDEIKKYAKKIGKW